MARPKAKYPSHLTGAFEEKCQREKNRLKTKLAKQLQEDIERLIDDDEYNDLVLKVKDREVMVNKFILMSRSSDFFEYLVKRLSTDGVISLGSGCDSAKFIDLVRQLSSTEHPETAVSQMKEMMTSLPKHQIPLSQTCAQDIQAANQSGNQQIQENSSPSTESNFVQLTYDKDSLSQCKTEKDSRNLNHYIDKSSEQNSVIDHLQNGQSSERDSTSEDTFSDLIKQSYKINIPHETCSKLGQDLLRQFLQEADTDCIISTEGYQIKCHRCILSSRCEYFSAMLSGNWIESDQNMITLEGVQFATIEQVLLYLYGGVTDLTESCSLAELLKTVDMFGIIGLKEVANSHLLRDNCHFFHKPCSVCQSKVPEALWIAVLYNLNDLRDKSLKWMSKHFCKVWPTKTFASLPDEILQLCFESTVKDLTAESVMDVMFDCQRITSTSPRLKWTEPLLDLTNKLMEASIEYTSQNFTSVLSSERFLSLGKHDLWSMGLLENIFPMVIKSLPTDKACSTYTTLCRLMEYSQLESCGWAQDFSDFVGTLFTKCENYMKIYIQQVVNTPDWDLLSIDQQSSIMKVASYVPVGKNEYGKNPTDRNKLPSMQKRSSGAMNALREAKTSLLKKSAAEKAISKPLTKSVSHKTQGAKPSKRNVSGVHKTPQINTSSKHQHSDLAHTSDSLGNDCSKDIDSSAIMLTTNAEEKVCSTDTLPFREDLKITSFEEHASSEPVESITDEDSVTPGSYFLVSDFSVSDSHGASTLSETVDYDVPDLDCDLCELNVSGDTHTVPNILEVNMSDDEASCHDVDICNLEGCSLTSQNDNTSSINPSDNSQIDTKQTQTFHVEFVPTIKSSSLNFNVPK